MSYDPSQPPPYQPPARPVSPRLEFWTSRNGVLILVGGTIAAMFIAAAIVQGLSTATEKRGFDVAVTSCEGTPGDLPSATVGFTVTNTGNTTRSATVRIEYRDSAGNRIDTDTSYVRDVEPGDTVRSQESTLLDAPPDGSMTCVIVGVS